MDSNGGSTREIDSLPISLVQAATADENSYYLAGKDRTGIPLLIKVNAATDEFIDLYPRGKYDVYDIVHLTDQGLTFQGLRLTDEANVLIQIDPTGQEILLEESFDQSITTLTPLGTND